MKEQLLNEKGLAVNIALAMVFVSIVIAALVSLINLDIDDRNSVVLMQDKIQQEELMRSESDRIIIMQGKGNFRNRRVEIIGRDRIATHIINYRTPAASIITNPNYIDQLGTAHMISTMCVTHHKRKNAITFNSRRSPVETYFDKLTRRSSLAQFQYFTDREISDLTNDPGHLAARVRFNGDDELFGRVHSNEDIVIQNVNGWPRFHALTTTSGIFLRQDSGTQQATPLSNDLKPMIFLGGWKENVPPIDYNPDAFLIKKNGTLLDGSTTPDITYIELNKNTFTKKFATITIPPPERIVVYSSYPDGMAHQFIPSYYNANPQTMLNNLIPNNRYAISDLSPTATSPFHTHKVVGDSLWTNFVAFAETTWAAGSDHTISNRSFWTKGHIWLKNSNRDDGISGKLTLASMKNSYILNDITYLETETGRAPDGWRSGTDYSGPVNPSDMFGLVSENSIIIKYKYWTPEENPEYRVVERGPSGQWHLYGAYSAQGGQDDAMGLAAWRSEGVFTFEYHHPKGSPMGGMSYRFKRNPSNPNQAIPMDFEDIYDPDTGELIVRWPIPVEVSRIDMHRFKYPPDPGNQSNYNTYSWRRWPGNTSGRTNLGFPMQTTAPGNQGWWLAYDYPWYNPVYPEPLDPWANSIRGTLNIWGSIAQRRRGFIRRSGNETEDNPDTKPWWDLDRFDAYGPPFYPEGNYIYGGGHQATGYARNYHFDRRFYWEAPPDYPEVYYGSGANKYAAFEAQTYNYKVPPKNWIYSNY